jgi:hypothetical protein
MTQFKRRLSAKKDEDCWERRYKIASFIATGISTLSVIAGGVFGLYTYHQKSAQENLLRSEELRLRKYTQVREMYFQLVDAAAAVGTSNSKAQAVERLSEFDRIYFGRAHIYVLDKNVADAKIKFYWNAHELIDKENFPSRNISKYALLLSTSCKNSLETMESK